MRCTHVVGSTGRQKGPYPALWLLGGMAFASWHTQAPRAHSRQHHARLVAWLPRCTCRWSKREGHEQSIPGWEDHRMSNKPTTVWIAGLVIAVLALGSALSYAQSQDRDTNPPGSWGGAGTNWENRPGPQGGRA
jgi:hypothetical protein